LTFEVQQVMPKELGGGLKVQTFWWGIVVGWDEFNQALVRPRREIRFSGKGAAHATDAAFLPR
jgi:hypothetical protein